MDRLLKNAVESIRVGVEDYETQEDVRGTVGGILGIRDGCRGRRGRAPAPTAQGASRVLYVPGTQPSYEVKLVQISIALRSQTPPGTAVCNVPL